MIKPYVLILLATFASQQTYAQDGVSTEIGTGKDTTIIKLAVQKHSALNYDFLTENNLKVYWEADVAELKENKYRDVFGERRTLIDFGLTPVLRWEKDQWQGLFLEVGIGAHYFTEIYNNDGRLFGSEFQFGDHLGVGYHVNRHLELTLKFQHYSDADIKQPNPGLNVAMLKFAYAF